MNINHLKYTMYVPVCLLIGSELLWLQVLCLPLSSSKMLGLLFSYPSSSNSNSETNGTSTYVDDV